MTSYPIKITFKKVHVHDGVLILGEDALYFFSKGKENVLKTAVAKGIGKELGGAIGSTLARNIREAAKKNADSEMPEELTQETLDAAVQNIENSMKFEAGKINKIQHNWMLRVIKYDGRNYGLPDGISKELRTALAPWAQKNNVKTKGF